MLLGFTGNHFLAEERAREVLSARGVAWRDVPRVSGDDVRTDALAPLLVPSLFGEATVLVDLEGVKVTKDLTDLLARADATVAVLDPNGPATRVKLYEKHGEHHASPAPTKPGEVAGWVAGRARALRLKLDRDAAMYLAEVFSADLAGIVAELNKLAFLDVPTLTRDVVTRVVGREAPGDSFAMLGAATAGRPGEAAGQLRRLLASGEDPFKLMGAVVWQYSLVARCVALLQEGGAVNEHTAASRLGVKPYPAKKALEVARRLNEGKIRAHLRRIQDADQAMKSGQDPASTLERLLVSLSL
ncbi:DNA polymerase III subunit delta [Deinococcus maricopensis]|uniref:DNA-directed DNA polymerase n=1 Tax=Deinococcus maricopensis (strain DSM 21211 / LMG 22137 / NRRL B-23946 / LB-34) TaxID=709986 RepID=E8U7A6_DEIML|nr:DNA polymerase III subunit delta [Deinococcus maricopensis]ADV66945.1 DNA polymerase III, delta subunit [Deinococcus maricopensis DSM 21211]